MALGLTPSEIENSRLRVLRVIATMAIGADAFADQLNAFSKSMNRGHRLSQRFASARGSTQCRAMTQCDIVTSPAVRRNIDGGGTARCKAIAQSVAQLVREMIESAAAAESVLRGP